MLDQAPLRLFKLDASVDTGMEFGWVYQVDTDKPLVPNLEEMSGGDWFDPAEVDRWVNSVWNRFPLCFDSSGRPTEHLRSQTESSASVRLGDALVIRPGNFSR